MAMSEFKQRLLRYELAKSGFSGADYHPESGNMLIDPNNDRMPRINDAGDIHYGTEYDHLAMFTLRPLVDRVNELLAVWENAVAMPFEEVSRFRKLAEYNNIVLAARDDSGKGYGMHFVTWQYNRDRTGVDLGHYGTDYTAAKEDFTVRAGLIPETKLFTKEQAAAIQHAIAYRIENYSGLPLEAEVELREIHAQLAYGYALPKTITKTKTPKVRICSEGINGEIQSGDLVITSSTNKYDSLIGKVTRIDKHGTPDHDTGNPGDDIHVDYTVIDYSEKMKARILELFDNYGSTAIFFEDLQLDDVIMASDMLIRISELDSQQINKLAESYEAADEYCESILIAKNSETPTKKLIDRLERNFTNCIDSMRDFDGDFDEFLCYVHEISALFDAHQYLTEMREFSDEDTDFFLKFKDPLMVVADEWARRQNNLSELDWVIDYVVASRKALFDDYEMISDDEISQMSPDHSCDEEIKPLDIAAAPTKTSIEDRLRTAQEKVDAQSMSDAPGFRDRNRNRSAIE